MATPNSALPISLTAYAVGQLTPGTPYAVTLSVAGSGQYCAYTQTLGTFTTQ